VKLAILTQYYPPEMGAPQARLSELAEGFAAAGHDVSVLTAMPNYPTGVIHPGYGGAWKRETRGGVRVLRTCLYPTQRADRVRRLASYFSFVASSACVGTALLDPPDYLMVESPPLFLGLSGAWLGRRTRARVIFNVSDLWPDSAIRLGLVREGSLACRMSERLEAYCYRRAWLVTGQSRGILESIAERFPSSARYHLSNGVDVARFAPERAAPTAPAVRASLACNGSTLALYAGLHGLAQGLEQILAVAHELRGDDVRFALVGDGPDKRALQDEARTRALDNVGFHDPRPRDEMPALVAAADIVLVTLKTELPGAVPSKLYEAMASSRAIVLVATGEPAEIVRRSEAGLVVPPGDTAALAQAIRTLAADPELRARLGANGRRCAEREYDRATIIARFMTHLEEHLHDAPAH
jgi:glycosyltransferase involved in cell wall biosynthesis